MKKMKRTGAILGVVLLVALYGMTLVFALIDSPWAMDALKISIGFTILIPVLLWVYLAMFRYMEGRKHENQDTASETDKV